MPSQNPPESLEEVRVMLEGFEELLCKAFAERAKYPLNWQAYRQGEASTLVSSQFGSYLRMKEYNMKGFNSERRPFVLRKNSQQINVNGPIFEHYLGLLDKICEQGESTDLEEVFKKDAAALELLSERIHLGEYVAAIKYAEDPKGYDALIRARNTGGIIDKLRDEEVEIRIANRYREKAEAHNLPGQHIADFFTNAILKLTIKVEVDYFMQNGR